MCCILCFFYKRLFTFWIVRLNTVPYETDDIIKKEPMNSGRYVCSNTWMIQKVSEIYFSSYLFSWLYCLSCLQKCGRVDKVRQEYGWLCRRKMLLYIPSILLPKNNTSGYFLIHRLVTCFFKNSVLLRCEHGDEWRLRYSAMWRRIGWYEFAAVLEERTAVFRIKVKGKAFPLQAWTGPWVSRRLRLQNF
jgi:hypothetical protein